GLLLGLLFIKPNLAIFFPPLCLLARQWRVLAGIALGLALLVLSSLPLGLARWHEYALTTRGYMEAIQRVVPMWKQLTLYAFWSGLSGVPGPLTAPMAAAWMASIILVAGATALAWWRRGASGAASPRLFGLTVLLALS